MYKVTINFKNGSKLEITTTFEEQAKILFNGLYSAMENKQIVHLTEEDSGTARLIDAKEIVFVAFEDGNEQQATIEDALNI